MDGESGCPLVGPVLFFFFFFFFFPPVYRVSLQASGWTLLPERVTLLPDELGEPPTSWVPDPVFFFRQ